MKLYSQSSKKFLILQETEALKKFLIFYQKKEKKIYQQKPQKNFLYFRRNFQSHKNENFLYFSKNIYEELFLKKL